MNVNLIDLERLPVPTFWCYGLTAGSVYTTVAYYATYAPAPAYNAFTCAFTHGATVISGTSAYAFAYLLLYSL